MRRAARHPAFHRPLPQGFDTRSASAAEAVRRRKAAGRHRRTLVKNPPILVLDEATSALDSRTEQEILRRLRRVSEHRTTIAIATGCRPSPTRTRSGAGGWSSGRESGSHHELLRRDGLYAEMWSRQQADARDAERGGGE
jgi:ATP-binding cassette subfamily B protein